MNFRDCDYSLSDQCKVSQRQFATVHRGSQTDDGPKKIVASKPKLGSEPDLPNSPFCVCFR